VKAAVNVGEADQTQHAERRKNHADPQQNEADEIEDSLH
jgi:hypothetical protein